VGGLRLQSSTTSLENIMAEIVAVHRTSSIEGDGAGDAEDLWDSAVQPLPEVRRTTEFELLLKVPIHVTVEGGMASIKAFRPLRASDVVGILMPRDGSAGLCAPVELLLSAFLGSGGSVGFETRRHGEA
jgi:hypothetical protein